jgi:transcriptional regulator with XRE-family HTH domain
LKQLRELLGFTQKEAAMIFDVDANTWARWERGQLGMHPGHVKLIRRVQARALRSRDKYWVLHSMSENLIHEAIARQGRSERDERAEWRAALKRMRRRRAIEY